MHKVDIGSFISFIKETDSFELFVETVVFRGQPLEGNLLPAIARRDPTVDTSEKEKLLIDQLLLQGAPMLTDAGSAPLDVLVVAQHYGLQTRLLDWTTNPLVALWFACSGREKGDVFVYALEADKLLAKDVYSQDPYSTSTTRVFQPRLNNARIVAQQGWFTLHRYANSNKKFVALEKNPQIKQHLHEYRIPSKRRAELLSALDRHGVSARTVFPDLLGLCQHLNWRHCVA